MRRLIGSRGIGWANNLECAAECTTPFPFVSSSCSRGIREKSTRKNIDSAAFFRKSSFLSLWCVRNSHQSSAITHLTTNPILPHLSPTRTHNRKLLFNNKRMPYPPRRQPSLPRSPAANNDTSAPSYANSGGGTPLSWEELAAADVGNVKGSPRDIANTPSPPKSNSVNIVHHRRRTRRTWWGRQAASPRRRPRRPPFPNLSLVQPRAFPPPLPLNSRRRRGRRGR